MSNLYWDTSLPGSGSGGTIQTLQLNGTTLSLVPDGGSVTLPTGIVSSLGPVVVVSSIQALDSMYIGPNQEIELLSTGDIYCSNVFNNLTNSFAGNFNTLTTTSLNATTANIQNINTTTLNPSTINGRQVTTSSIRIGDFNRYLNIHKDYATPATEITQDINQVYMRTNVDIPSPYVFSASNGYIDAITGNTVNIDTYVSTDTVYTSLIDLNGKDLSNDSQNLYYDGKVIFTGQRGDASQWSKYPAVQGINLNGNSITNAGQTLIMTNPSDTGGTFQVGFPDGATLDLQPNINLYGATMNIAAGAPTDLTYTTGRTVNIDSYAGALSGSKVNIAGHAGTGVFAQNGSQINVDAYGGLSFPAPFPGIAGGGAINLSAHGGSLGTSVGAGRINLTAYSGINNVGDLSPSEIVLNGANVSLGNNNTLPFGATTNANVQAVKVQIIAGSVLIPTWLFTDPTLVVRAGYGMELQTDPGKGSNTDSRIYVKEIYAQSNSGIIPEPVGEYLTLDGKSGGITLNNFKVANGQGGGAALNNIAFMSGSYPLSVQNQINALAGSIANISTTGGTSNLAEWYIFPALSTVNFNKGINLVDGTISSIDGVRFYDQIGELATTFQHQVYLDGSSLGNASTTIMMENSTIVGFRNPGTNLLNTLRTGGVYLGESALLNVSGSNLTLNGVPIVSAETGPNPSFSTIEINQGGNILMGSSLAQQTAMIFNKDISGLSTTILAMEYNDNNNGVLTLSVQDQVGYADDLEVGGLYSYGRSNIYAGPQPYTCINGPVIRGTDLALSNVSSINGVAWGGGGGVSSIQNWSYYPVLNDGIQFGNQTAWIKGGGNALFTTSNGVNTIPVAAKAFSVFDTNNPGVVAEIGFNENGVVTMKKNGLPTEFKVSTLGIMSSIMSVDSASQLSVDDRKVAAQWSAYPVLSTVTAITAFTAPTRIMDLKNVGTSSFSIHLEYDPPGIAPSDSLDITVGGGENRIASTWPGQFYTPMRIDADALTINTVNPSGTRFGFLNSNDYSFIRGSFVSTGTLNATKISTSAVGFTTGGILTTSGTDLFFNGNILNTSNAINNWASYPASQGVNMSNFSLFNTNSATAINGAWNLYSNAVDLNVATNISISNANFSTVALQTVGNINSFGYHYGSFGYAFGSSPNQTSNYMILQKPSFSTNLTIQMISSSTAISTGTIYDTVFNPLPPSPVYGNTTLINSNVSTVTYTYPGSPFTYTNLFDSFVPSTTFAVLSGWIGLPLSINQSTIAQIGVGPVGNIQIFNQQMMTLNPLTTYQNFSLNLDFTDYMGSNITLKTWLNQNGTLSFKNVRIKWLPN